MQQIISPKKLLKDSIRSLRFAIDTSNWYEAPVLRERIRVLWKIRHKPRVTINV